MAGVFRARLPGGRRLAVGAAIVAAVPAAALLWPEISAHVLASDGFMPHGHCYLWKPGLVWLHLVSDSLIGASYLAISATLAFLVHRARKEIPFHWMILAFGLFIVACGATHFMEVWTLWRPTYWLAGDVKAVTALASVLTAIALPPIVPRVLALIEAAKRSEQRKLELEMAHAEMEELYRRVKELDEVKTRLFANVSHELRTPLTLILGPTQKLLGDDGLPEPQRRELNVVARNARILLKHVNDLLDISKLQSGRMEIHHAEVDLARLVRLTTAHFDSLAKERRIQFSVSTPVSLPAQVDPEKVQRVLFNLLSNAFKFAPDAGVVRCELDDAGESEQPAGAPRRATITVRDNGPGVAPELRDAIFERFRRGDAPEVRKVGGTGLGLAIARELVELHGGAIRVDEASGGGALFTVSLPLTAPAGVQLREAPADLESPDEIVSQLMEGLRPAGPPIEPTPAARDGAAAAREEALPTVLVVEDNPEMNRFVSESLAAEFHVVCARDGREGLRKAVELVPDLIVSDLMMPEMDGEELVRELRVHPELDTVPILLLSAKADDALRVRLLREGAQDYLMKPFFAPELLARVRNMVATRRAHQMLQRELEGRSGDIAALAGQVVARTRKLRSALDALREREAQYADLLTSEQSARAEAEAANRAKDEFLAMLSHELRTPLQAILGWARMLQTGSLDPAAAERALETLERNAGALAKLVQDLLDVSSIVTGRLTLEVRSLAVAPVVDAAIESVRLGAEAKAIRIEGAYDPSAGPVSGDPERLQQVFWNLLSNAIKFTPPGGSVRVRLARVESEIEVSVSDTGQGIPADFLPRVFDRFRQADGSTTRQYGGLGLGLAIARHIVELHGGSVRAESEGEGRGSTFTVRLPLTRSPVAAPAGSLGPEDAGPVDPARLVAAAADPRERARPR